MIPKKQLLFWCLFPRRNLNKEQYILSIFPHSSLSPSRSLSLHDILTFPWMNTKVIMRYIIYTGMNTFHGNFGILGWELPFSYYKT